MIHVLARANVPAVKAENGCIEDGAAIDAENALSFRTPNSFAALPHFRFSSAAWTLIPAD
jgi:hypothetical protein